MDKSLILKEIKKHYKFKTDGEFAEFLGIKQNTLSNWSARNTMDYEKVISKCEDIDGNWLLTGSGQMLKKQGFDSLINRADKAIAKAKEVRNLADYELVNEQSGHYGRLERHLIPLYDGIMTAGMQETAMLDPTSDSAEMIDTGDWFRDATAAMRVHGDSMHPEYKSGSIVALREVQNKRLVVYGQDYLIETTEYRVIKRLQRSELPNSWLACSVNEERYTHSGRLIHEAFDIHIDDAKRLYHVVGNVIRTQSTTIFNPIHNRKKK